MKVTTFVIPLNPLEGDYETMFFTTKKVILQFFTFNL